MIDSFFFDNNLVKVEKVYFDSMNLLYVEEFDDNSTLIRQYMISDGQFHGKYTEFFGSGNPRAEIIYEMGMREDAAFTYYDVEPDTAIMWMDSINYVAIKPQIEYFRYYVNDSLLCWVHYNRNNHPNDFGGRFIALNTAKNYTEIIIPDLPFFKKYGNVYKANGNYLMANPIDSITSQFGSIHFFKADSTYEYLIIVNYTNPFLTINDSAKINSSNLLEKSIGKMVN